jgi:Ion channel
VRFFRATPTWLWLALYALLWPLFGLFYYTAGVGNFSESSLQLEPGVFESQRQKLAEVSLTGLQDIYKDNWERFDNNLLAIGDQSAGDPTVHDGYISFKLVGNLVEDGGPSDDPIVNTFAPEAYSVGVEVETVGNQVCLSSGGCRYMHRITFDDPVMFAREVPDPPTLHFSDKITPIGAYGYTVQVEGGEPKDYVATDSMYSAILVAKANEDKFQSAYAAIHRNDPFAAGGWYDHANRALYLSGVTMTTLGFGDVVPITNKARLFVMAEALCGVVLGGIAIAKVASSLRDTREEPARPRAQQRRHR